MQPEEQKNQRKNRRKKQEMPREKIPKEQDRNEEGDNYAKFHLLLDDAGPHSTCRKRFRNRRLMELDFSSFKIQKTDSIASRRSRPQWFSWILVFCMVDFLWFFLTRAHSLRQFLKLKFMKTQVPASKKDIVHFRCLTLFFSYLILKYKFLLKYSIFVNIILVFQAEEMNKEKLSVSGHMLCLWWILPVSCSFQQLPSMQGRVEFLHPKMLK